MNKTLKYVLISCCLILSMVVGVFATTGGWKLLTATSNFQVVEGIVAEYYEVRDSSWHRLPLDQSVVEFGQASINAGETNTFYLRAMNNASNGKIGLIVTMGNAEGLSHSVICTENSTGTKYTVTTDGIVYIELPADGNYKQLGFTTTASGNIAVTQLTFNNTVERDNALEGYESVCE